MIMTWSSCNAISCICMTLIDYELFSIGNSRKTVSAAYVKYLKKMQTKVCKNRHIEGIS